MKKISKKSVVLFATAMAVCAFVPSMASAASWSVVGSHHTLDSANLGFVMDSSATLLSCGESTFTATVTSASDMRITAATFRRCTSSGPAIGTCTWTSTATSLPWRATPISTTSATIDGIRIDVLLENPPAGATCGAAGINLLYTGSFIGGWNNTSHHLTLNGTTGLVAHSPLGNGVAVTSNGTIRDTQQTLVINP